MDRVAFRTDGGSAYVLDFKSEGIEVVRVSDHPITGHARLPSTFATRYDAAEFRATVHGIRVHFRSQLATKPATSQHRLFRTWSSSLQTLEVPPRTVLPPS